MFRLFVDGAPFFLSYWERETKYGSPSIALLHPDLSLVSGDDALANS
jgi:hypothetical protein